MLHKHLSHIFATTALAMAMVGCSDNIFSLDSWGDETNRFIFDVSVSEINAKVLGNGTRADYAEAVANSGLSLKAMAPQRLPVKGKENTMALTITDVAGVLPTAASRALAQQGIAGEFAVSAGWAGTREAVDQQSMNLLYNWSSTQQGETDPRRMWPNETSYARFYGVYPRPEDASGAITMTDATHTGAPQITYTVNANCTDQVEMLTAVSGIKSKEQVPLHFNYALTAVNIAAGDNFSPDYVITGVKIMNVKTKATYTFPQQETTAGAPNNSLDRWSNYGYRNDETPSGDYVAASYSLSDANAISTYVQADSIIAGKLKQGNNATDNYTFLMIPQQLPSNAKMVITLKKRTANGLSIPADVVLPLSPTGDAEWVPGTVVTYQLTQNNSSWNYIIRPVRGYTFINTIDSISSTLNDEVWVQSFRYVEGADGNWYREGVPFEVKGYYDMLAQDPDVYHDGTPDYLDISNGSGVTPANLQAKAPVYSLKLKFTSSATTEDIVADRTQQMREATSVANYDLSLHDATGSTIPQTTANCYVISKPGTYKIPLVYGNAIVGGAYNKQAYAPSEANPTKWNSIKDKKSVQLNADGNISREGSAVLPYFKDYKNQDIKTPYIYDSNPGPLTASLQWQSSDMISNLQLVGSGHEAYLTFTVGSAIQPGNAIVGVKDSENNYVWGWHLWFTTPDALATDALTVDDGPNQKKNIQMGKETLGWTYLKYKRPANRKVKIKLQQTEKHPSSTNYETTSFIVEDEAADLANSDNQIDGYAPSYLWGSPFAYFLPMNGKLTDNGKNAYTLVMSTTPSVQFFNRIKFLDSSPRADQISRNIENERSNFWSAFNGNSYTIESTNNVEGYQSGPQLDNTPVVKTIYDPCPAGFRVPGGNEFSWARAEISDGKSLTSQVVNVVGKYNGGWHVLTRNATSDEREGTVFLQGAGKLTTNNISGADFGFWTAQRYYVYVNGKNDAAVLLKIEVSTTSNIDAANAMSSTHSKLYWRHGTDQRYYIRMVKE